MLILSLLLLVLTNIIIIGRQYLGDLKSLPNQYQQKNEVLF